MIFIHWIGQIIGELYRFILACLPRWMEPSHSFYDVFKVHTLHTVARITGTL
ncbi:hypothetical protein DSTSK_16640 [Desulforhabdus sp. TSK]|nr:hypothetical protein DSTSK_16640 [Desulforhabdus sp. TSK]